MHGESALTMKLVADPSVSLADESDRGLVGCVVRNLLDGAIPYRPLNGGVLKSLPDMAAISYPAYEQAIAADNLLRLLVGGFQKSAGQFDIEGVYEGLSNEVAPRGIVGVRRNILPKKPKESMDVLQLPEYIVEDSVSPALMIMQGIDGDLLPAPGYMDVPWAESRIWSYLDEVAQA